MITKFRTAGCSLGLVLGTALSFGCTSIPLAVEKTEPDDAVILQSKTAQAPKRIIFLSPKEAKCPTRCSTLVESETRYLKFLTHIEQRLQERGYNLISGAIVSRIEEKLLEGRAREEWDRTEKALLLGKETGADAILEVRALYLDEKKRNFLKEMRTKEFREKPEKAVDIAINEWEYQRPTRWWWWIPIFGWAYYYVAYDPPSRYAVPVWESHLNVRMIDLDGKVIWSGYKTVRITDIIPDNWEGSLDPDYPQAKINRTIMGQKEENFDYYQYQDNTELLEKQLYMLIDSLIAQLPDPR